MRSGTTAINKMSGPILSIIVVVDLARRPSELVRRVQRIVLAPGMEEFEIVIAHNNRGDKHDHLFTRLINRFSHVRLVSHAFYEGAVNAGLLRNRALEHATAPLVMLLDADLYPDPGLFLGVARHVMQGREGVLMLPCLYLSHWASTKLCNGRMSIAEIVNAYYKFDRRYFMHMASPSSVLIFRRADYFIVGGFDEDFSGHGYEDFDFMVRLAVHLGKISICDELLENRTYRAPLLAEGFRKHLGRISLPHLIEKKIALHLHHGRISSDQYYVARETNAEKFFFKISRLLQQKEVTDETRPDLLIEDFFRVCREKGVAARDYFVLFDTRPGHIDRLSSWVDRIKFVLGYR